MQQYPGYYPGYSSDFAQ